MPDTNASTVSPFASLGRWARVMGVILVSLGLAFGAWLLVSSQLLVSSAHQRNWENLSIVADAFSRWPREVRINAERKLTAAKEKAGPPASPGNSQAATRAKVPEAHKAQVGIAASNVEIEETPCAELDGPAHRSAYFLPGNRPDGSDFFAFNGTLPAAEGASATKKERCFKARIPLTSLVPLGNGDTDFSGLLIANSRGNIVAQIGEKNLPVSSLAGLKSVSAFARSTADKLIDPNAAAQSTQLALSVTEGVGTIRIADVDYFAYLSPFTLAGRNQACPVGDAMRLTMTASGTAAPANSAPSVATSQQQADNGTCLLYAVGLMPAQMLRQAWYRPSAQAFTAFGLALLFAIGLLPLLRLVLIGGSEALTRFQLATLLFGVSTAAAVAMLACLFVYDSGVERLRAAEEAREIAAQLISEAGTDIGGALAELPACPSSVDGGAKPFHYAGMFSSEGIRPEPQTKCGAAMPVTSDIGLRHYFRDLDGPAAMRDGARRYTISEIRIQLDSSREMVIATRSDGSDRTLVATVPFHDFNRPILPDPQHFLVVDGSDPSMPVLFHSQPVRAGVEKFAVQGSTARDVPALLAGLAFDGSASSSKVPVSFQGIYDGRSAQFSAGVIPHTRWILIVYHDLDDVDAIAGQTTVLALAGWASFAIPIAALCALLLLATRCRWENLWPFEAASDLYLIGAWAMVGAIVPGMLAAAAGLSFAVPLMLICASAAMILFAVLLLKARPTREALSLRTEQRYRGFVLAALLCASIGPTFAFWSDARVFTHSRVDHARLAALHTAVTQRSDYLRDAGADRSISGPGIEEVGELKETETTAGESVPQLIVPPNNFTSRAWELVGQLPLVDVAECPPDAGAFFWACMPSAAKFWDGSTDEGFDRVGVMAHRPGPPDLLVVICVIGTAAALAALLYVAVYYGLWSLTGFGIPLNAVKWPSLLLGTPKASDSRDMKLARRTLLVAPQQIVRDAVSNGALLVNLADTLLPISGTDLAVRDDRGLPAKLPSWKAAQAKRLIVTGLDLILRDPDRRGIALTYLELAAEAVSPGKAELAELIVIAEMSPLERILDAFGAGEADNTAREDLRWARLFQNFTTFSFAPIDKVSQTDLDTHFPPTPANCPRRTLVEELRWLPGNVIDGAIANGDAIATLEVRYPLGEDSYQRFYTSRLIEWAESIDPSTEAAAIDFLRSNLIEHYEQCWAASSLSERMVLDTIARGGYVNMRKAVALQSLVRRGLVILDPAPRLMNRSFAMYVRQTERPDTLEQLRAQQPPSSWSLARLPIAVVLPAAFLLFVIAAAESGQSLTALLPMLAAGAPALIGLTFGSRRGA